MSAGVPTCWKRRLQIRVSREVCSGHSAITKLCVSRLQVGEGQQPMCLTQPGVNRMTNWPYNQVWHMFFFSMNLASHWVSDGPGSILILHLLTFEKSTQKSERCCLSFCATSWPRVSAWSPGGHGLWRTPPWSLPVSKGHKTNCGERGDSGERQRALSHQMAVLPVWRVVTLLFFPRCRRMDCWCCTLPWSCPPRREQRLSDMLFGFKGELVFSHWKFPLSLSITGHSWNTEN